MSDPNFRNPRADVQAPSAEVFPTEALPFDLLDRHLAGQATDTDRQAIQQWSAAAPERAPRLTRLTGGVQGIHETYTDPAEITRRILDGAVVGRNSSAQNTLTRAPLGLRRFGMLTTGVALIGIMAAGLWWNTQETSRQRQYTTHLGQRRFLTFADGSHIILAPRATLTLGRDFGQRARTMSLDGEAYFDLTPHTQQPWIVQTGRVTTRVLGTTFDVEHDAAARTVRVTVVRGKVACATTDTNRNGVNHPATLTALQSFHADDSTQIVTRGVDVDAATQWTTGHLVFKGALVPELLATVGRWYGLQLQLADSTLVHERVSVALDGESSATMLRTLQRLLNVTAVVHDSIVILHSQGIGMSPAQSRPTVHQTYSPSFEVGR